jgi:hypothetical protein
MARAIICATIGGMQVFVLLIANPAVNAPVDLVRPPAGRSGFHGVTFKVRAGPRSSGWKFAATNTGSGATSVAVLLTFDVGASGRDRVAGPFRQSRHPHGREASLRPYRQPEAPERDQQ